MLLLNKYIYKLASRFNNHKLIRLFFKKIFNILYSIPHKNKSTKNFNTYSLEVFTKLIEALNECNIEYWLMFGTLLGAVRDKNFIHGDTDIDIGISDIYLNNDIIDFQLSKYGFIKIQKIIYKNEQKYVYVEETYRLNNINIDIFYCKRSKNIIECCDFINFQNLSWDTTLKKYGGYIPRKISLPFKGLIEIYFLGLMIKVPKNYIEILKFHYGDNYLHKIQNWDSSLSKSIEIQTNSVGYIEFYN